MASSHYLRESSEHQKSSEHLLKETSDEFEDSILLRTRKRDTLKFALQILSHLASFILCILLVAHLAFWTRYFNEPQHQNALKTYLRWDNCPVPDHCPTCPTFDSRGLYRTTFFNDHRYQSVDYKYDYLFEEMNYDGGVQMPNDEHGGETEGAVIAMFHQLHCLARMRSALQDASHGGSDWKTDIHWPHCVDYLRKVLLCHGDNTMERIQSSETFNGIKAVFINGTDDIRSCKKTGDLYELRQRYGEGPFARIGYNSTADKSKVSDLEASATRA